MGNPGIRERERLWGARSENENHPPARPLARPRFFFMCNYVGMFLLFFALRTF